MDANFNDKERMVARFLSKLPIIKKLVKRAYQILNYYRFKESNACQSDLYVNGLDSGETFFGYYDKSPLSPDGKFLLFHATNAKTNKKPNADNPIYINLMDFSSKKLIWKYPTTSYNWQQGARLQWLSDKEFIFNVFDKQRSSFGSIIYNLVTKSKRNIVFPIYDCFENKFALSLNYTRLGALSSDYGYRNSAPPSVRNLKDLRNDGIFYVDLIDNSVKLHVSLNEIVQFEFEKEMEESLHTVNHIMISPNGSQAMFIHRYFTKSKQRKDRLLLLNIESKSLKVLVNHGMVSHCTWFNDTSILGYLRNDLGVDTYYMLNTNTNSVEAFDDDNFSALGDGHPSVNVEKKIMVYDTYPNKARMKMLRIYNIETGLDMCLGSFREPLKYNGETRCDLHPRFSSDGNVVFFDSVHTGVRNLHWIVI